NHTGTATATDNCGGVTSVTYSDLAAGGCTGRDIDRTWTATDACGNTASRIQHITFADNTRPTITNCPAGSFLGYNLDEASLPTCATVKAQVVAADNCGGGVHVTCNSVD